MDTAAFGALVNATEDAIKTLTKLAEATSGWTRESVVLQLDGLRHALQEALNSATPALHHKPAVDKSVPIMGIIGHVHCINTAAHWPPQLRYYGHLSRETSGAGPTGQAHLHYENAVADVKSWYAGSKVPYEQQALVPLVPPGTSWATAARELETQGIARLAPAAAAGSELVAELAQKREHTQAHVTVALGSSFTIGTGNTYQQAWAAALAGHQIQLPDWSPERSWVFERTHKELLSVYGDNIESWKRSGIVVCPTGAHQLRTDWIVLPIVDFEEPTV